MMLSNKQITKALIRLSGCAGWSAPLLLAIPRRQVFSRRGPLVIGCNNSHKISNDIQLLKVKTEIVVALFGWIFFFQIKYGKYSFIYKITKQLLHAITLKPILTDVDDAPAPAC